MRIYNLRATRSLRDLSGMAEVSVFYPLLLKQDVELWSHTSRRGRGKTLDANFVVS